MLTGALFVFGLASSSLLLLGRCWLDSPPQFTACARAAPLDHSMWFHRAFRADQWLLVQAECLSYSHTRALTHCDGVRSRWTPRGRRLPGSLLRPRR